MFKDGVKINFSNKNCVIAASIQFARHLFNVIFFVDFRL